MMLVDALWGRRDLVSKSGDRTRTKQRTSGSPYTPSAYKKIKNIAYQPHIS